MRTNQLADLQSLESAYDPDEKQDRYVTYCKDKLDGNVISGDF